MPTAGFVIFRFPGVAEAVRYAICHGTQDDPDQPADAAIPPPCDAGNDWCGPPTRLLIAQNYGKVCLEVTMVDLTRRARLLREMEQEFVPDYDANSLPSADKRAAYALEHIAFRVSRIEQILARIATAIESALPPKG
jgi:hypothetical protein